MSQPFLGAPPPGRTRFHGAVVALLGLAMLAAGSAAGGKPGITLSVPGVAMKGDVIKVKVGVSGGSEGVWYHVNGLRFLRGYFDHCGWCDKPCLVNDQIQACPTPPDGCCFNYYCLGCGWDSGHEFSDTWHGGPTWEFEVTGCDTATIQAEYYGGQHEGPFMGPVHEIHILDGIEASFDASTLDACTGEEIFFSNTSCGGTSFHWSFGDGGSAQGEYVSHVFDTPGTYTVILTASSPMDSDQASATVNVAADCATIQGTITDAADASPLPGASVSVTSALHQRGVQTGTPGTYSVKVPPDETYSITASRPGYLDGGPVSVTPGPNETVTQDLALIPEVQDPVDPLADLGPEWKNVDDPVNPATGNFCFHRNLWFFPGMAALPLVFEVTYNSLDGDTDGPLGHGWTHSYNVFLTWTGLDFTLHLSDGSRRFFHHDTANGTYNPVNCHAFGVLEDRAPDGWTYTLPGGLTYELDALGRLERLVDLRGNAISLTYSTQLDRITDTAGRQVDLHYTGTRLTSITSPQAAGDIAGFAYDGNGNLTAITDARGNSWTFTYDAQHRMLTETNRRDILSMTNSYDAQGRVVRQTDAAGHDTTYTYTNLPGGRLQVVITPPSGHAVTHVYDGSGHLLRSTDGEGHTATFSYDANGLPTSLTDKMGNVATLEFDTKGNVTSLTDRLGARLQFQYDANGFMTQARDELGNTFGAPRDAAGNLFNFSLPDGNDVRFRANAQGLNTSMEDLGNNPWDLHRDAQGQVTRVTSRLGFEMNYHYDAAGRMTQADLPDGIGSWHFAYDAAGQLVSVTSPGGKVVTYTHDEEGNTTSRTFVPTQATTTWSYDNLGRLHSVTDPLGGVTTYTYDADSNLVAVTDPDGVTTHFAYDRRNARIATTTASGATTAYSYDPDGRLVAVTDPLGATWNFTYDAEGRLISSVDPLGNTTTRIHSPDDQRVTVVDPLGQETLIQMNAIGDVETTLLPNGDTIHHHWSSTGQILAVTDAGGSSWQYSYDTLHRMTRVEGPEGAREEYGYDTMGRRTTVRRPNGDLVAYDYDPDSWLTKIHRPDGTDVTFAYAYDATGMTTTITEPVGVTVLHQDLLGRFDRKTDPFGNTAALTYTPGGRLATVTYPGNHVVTYSYDAAGRLDHMTDWLGHVTRYHYDGADRVREIEFPNGTKVEYTFDDRGLLSRLTHTAGGTTLVDYVITRDALGRVTSMAVTGAPAAAPGDSVREDAFDRANRIETSITDMVATNFTFDASGRLVEKTRGNTVTTYTYDGLDRLHQVADGTHTTTYTMDWEGSRIRVVHDGTETRYLRRGNRLWAALDSANTPTQYYVTGPNGITYAVDAGGGIRVFHTDPQGSVVAVTDGAGTVTAVFTYDPYGKVLASTGQSELRYLGGWGVLADGNGLHETGLRMYDPELRRFLTPDPLGLEGSLNLYGYGSGDPANTVDPQGLRPNITSLGWFPTPRYYPGQSRTPGRFIAWARLNGMLVPYKKLELNPVPDRNFPKWVFRPRLRSTVYRPGVTPGKELAIYEGNTTAIAEYETAEAGLAEYEGMSSGFVEPKGSWPLSPDAERVIMNYWSRSSKQNPGIMQRVTSGIRKRGRELLSSLGSTYQMYMTVGKFDAGTAMTMGGDFACLDWAGLIFLASYSGERVLMNIPVPWNGTNVDGNWMTGDEIVYGYFLGKEMALWNGFTDDGVVWFRQFLQDIGLSYDDYLKIAASVGQ